MRIGRKPILIALTLITSIILPVAAQSHTAQCSIELPYINLSLDKQGTVCGLYYSPGRDHNRDKEWWDGVLKIGDKIIALNGKNIQTVLSETREEDLYDWGHTFVGGRITLMRKGKLITISLDEKRMARHWWWTFARNRKEVEERVAKIALRLVVTSSPSYEGIGIKLSTSILNPDERQRRPGHISAVVIKPGYPSPARDQGIKPGDRIAAVNDIKIPITMNRFQATRVIAEAITSSSEPVKLLIERGDSTFEATMQKTKIFDGAGERFFRNRTAVQKLDTAIQSLNQFDERVLFNWMEGKTIDASGNDLTGYFANMHFYIVTNLNLLEATHKDMETLDHNLSWWSENDCLFLENSSCDS